ncbi:branched-chain amino acid ABC transporter substrate-binding protein [Candidatus Desantisbacteria bacterium]|nr:branched-chain amino acid ABC transporter substrate-binding protein [Candidatus Desantisbacteria bacterium]
MFRILLVLFGISIGIIGCGKAPEGEQVVKVALVCPLTGDIAAMGQGMKRGAEMAVEEANASGRFQDAKIELAAFDDRSDPKEAVNVANQVISDAKIAGVIGHLNSGCSIPASQIYAKRNLLMMTPASTNPKLTLQGLKNVFRVCTTDDVQGSFGANYCIDKLKITTVAVIQDKTAYGQGLAEEFKKQFESRGGKILSFDGINIGDKDFRALLTRIKNEKPALLYFGGMYSECGLITKQAKELGLQVPVVSGDGIFSPEYINIGGKSTEGDYASMIGTPPEKLPKAKTFMDKFKAKYPGVDMQPYDTYTYEATCMLIEAIEKTNFEPVKIID